MRTFFLDVVEPIGVIAPKASDCLRTLPLGEVAQAVALVLNELAQPACLELLLGHHGYHLQYFLCVFALRRQRVSQPTVWASPKDARNHVQHGSAVLGLRIRLSGCDGAWVVLDRLD